METRFGQNGIRLTQQSEQQKLQTAISYLEQNGYQVIESSIRRQETLNAGAWKRRGFFIRDPQGKSCNLSPMSPAGVIANAQFIRNNVGVSTS